MFTSGVVVAVLRECRVIPGVARAVALVRSPETGVFTVGASLGLREASADGVAERHPGWALGDLSTVELTPAEAEARCTAEAEEVSQDVFVLRGAAGPAGEALRQSASTPRTLLVVRIRVEGEVEGYLIFEKDRDKQAFAGHDVDLLKRLRQHFVSAFDKARSLRRVEQARGRAEEERARAEEANRAKSVFLANMSHELRTPLNGILGFAELMARRAGRDAEDRQHLGTIARSGEHLLGLINDVLSLAKIEAGRLTLTHAPLDPRALLGSLVEMLRVRAEAKDLTLSLDAAGLPRAVVGDEGRLRQVLINLLGNAIKFTTEGGVRLRATWTEGRGVFEVEDTGPGIAPEEMAQLFHPFVQTQTGRRSTEGTGLGLAHSREIARLMGGDITVTSVVGRGSTFRCEVPLPSAADDVSVPSTGDTASRLWRGSGEGK